MAALATAASAEPVAVVAEPVATFAIGSAQTRFGALEFVRGLVLRSDDENFGGISGFRLLSGDRFLAVSDQGRWFAGAIERRDDGALAGVTAVESGPLVAAARNGKIAKRDGDCEGLAVTAGRAYLSFERNHRIATVDLKGGLPSGLPKTLPLGLKGLALKSNAGLEALALAPDAGSNPALLVAIAEEAPDSSGNLRGFLIRGKKIAEFAIVRSDGYAITDADFLPGGDLLILERDFSFRLGPRMRIRRLPGKDLAPGALLDGPVLIEADAGYRIDNMEALSVSTDAAGEVRLTLVSDNNYTSLQRTMMLEFRLAK